MQTAFAMSLGPQLVIENWPKLPQNWVKQSDAACGIYFARDPGNGFNPLPERTIEYCRPCGGFGCGARRFKTIG